MSSTKTSLTVTFEAPFWIGLYERESDGAYEVCKITFGAEPKDYEVYEFLLRNWHGLSFSPKLQGGTLSERRLNGRRFEQNGRRTYYFARRQPDVARTDNSDFHKSIPQKKPNSSINFLSVRAGICVIS